MPGSFLAIAITSAIVLAGNDGCASSATGIEATSPIGAKSLRGSIAGMGVEARIDRDRAGVAEQQRVAVGRGLGDRAGADGAAGAGPVVDDELLAARSDSFGGDHARHGVDAAARRIRHDQRDGPRRVVGGARHCTAVASRSQAPLSRRRANRDMAFSPDLPRMFIICKIPGHGYSCRLPHKNNGRTRICPSSA